MSVELLTRLLHEHPVALLALRTICGLSKQEFAAATKIIGEVQELPAISAARVDNMEGKDTATGTNAAECIALTIVSVMNGELFGEATGGVVTKPQFKPDSRDGFKSAAKFAREGVPYSTLLHQRHYGGAFRQLLDATSTQRGDLIEDAVEALFTENRIPHVRTGAHNQGDVAERFELTVQPAPDFVVFDTSGTLRGILECKLTGDGGTARDKALRFERLRAESMRLGGIPLLAVLGGLGWHRTNDALGPVVRDCDGRVFSVGNLDEILNVAPFPQLIGLVPPISPSEVP
ncbi:MAG: hypothetical protein ACT4OS_09135 [Acidimicrobiales bacterium]